MSWRRVGATLAALAVAAGVPRAAVHAQTVDMRAGEARIAHDPRLRAVWERLRQACDAGCDKADVRAYERDSLDLLQAMGPLIGMTPGQMRRHVAAIPKQMLAIARDDPTVLSDYDRFVVALLGPP